MESSAFIYVLIDPRNLEVRYVGKTNKPTMRLWQHLHSKTFDAKKAWVDELLSQNLKPIMLVVSVLSSEEWKSAEIALIKKYRDAGVPLLNRHKGGGGGDKPTPEQLVQRSERMKTLWSDSDFRKKVSEAIREQHQSEDFVNQSRETTYRLWQSDEYRDKVIQAILASWESDERREDVSKRFKQYWQNPENKQHAIDCLKLAWQDDERRAAQSERNRKFWADESQREKRLRSIRLSHAAPEYREAQSKKIKARWDNPESRAKLVQGIKNSRTPKTSAITAECNKAAWNDPSKRAKRCEAMKKSWTSERRAAQAERMRLRRKSKDQ